MIIAEKGESRRLFSHTVLLTVILYAHVGPGPLVSQDDRRGGGSTAGDNGRKEGGNLLPQAGQSQDWLTPLGTLSAWWLQREEGGYANHCLPTR